jgi:hypothetical protein
MPLSPFIFCACIASESGVFGVVGGYISRTVTSPVVTLT